MFYYFAIITHRGTTMRTNIDIDIDDRLMRQAMRSSAHSAFAKGTRCCTAIETSTRLRNFSSCQSFIRDSTAEHAPALLARSPPAGLTQSSAHRHDYGVEDSTAR
jgi:hypothetical protein